MLIKKHLNKFLKSNYNNTQMDVYLNENVIMQIYNSTNVKKWGIVDMEIPNEEGIIIDLTFNNNKKNNKENVNRFLSSLAYNRFQKVNLDGGEVYFMYLSVINNNLNDLSGELRSILKEVYNLDETTIIEISVDAYW